MGRAAAPEQLARIPDWHRERHLNITKYAARLMGEDPQGIPNNLMPFVSQVAVGRLADGICGGCHLRLSAA